MYKGKSKKILTAALIIAALTATACGNSADDSEATSSKEETKATTAESVQSADDSLVSLPDSSVDDTSTITDSDTTLIVNESGGASEPTYSEYDSISPEPSTVKISSDWTDLEFVLEDEVYVLGKTTIQEVMDRGWTDTLVDGDKYDQKANESKVYMNPFFHNSDSVAEEVITDILIDNTITMYKRMCYDESSYSIFNMTLPGKITFGMTADDIIAAYGEPDVREDLGDKNVPDIYLIQAFNSKNTGSSVDDSKKQSEHREYTPDDFKSEKLTYYSDKKELSFEVSDLIGVCKIMIKSDKDQLIYCQF